MASILILDAIIAVFFWGFAALVETVQGERVSGPIAGTWLFLGGAAVGASSAYILGERVLPPGPFLGVSLIATPLLLGTLMEVTGRYQDRRGWHRSYLATWWGGALFGLGSAVGRLGSLGYLDAL